MPDQPRKPGDLRSFVEQLLGDSSIGVGRDHIGDVNYTLQVPGRSSRKERSDDIAALVERIVTAMRTGGVQPAGIEISRRRFGVHIEDYVSAAEEYGRSHPFAFSTFQRLVLNLTTTVVSWGGGNAHRDYRTPILEVISRRYGWVLAKPQEDERDLATAVRSLMEWVVWALKAGDQWVFQRSRGVKLSGEALKYNEELNELLKPPEERSSKSRKWLGLPRLGRR